MNGINWMDIISALVVSIAVSVVVKFGAHLKIDSPRISLSFNIIFGLYVAIVITSIFIIPNGQSVDLNDISVAFGLVTLPLLVLIFYKKMSYKQKDFDPELESLRDFENMKNMKNPLDAK